MYYTLYSLYSLYIIQRCIMALTKDQIIQAAEEIQGTGETPTMEKIRTLLGGGSYSDISPALRHWKQSKEQRATLAIQMPNEAKAALDRAGIDLWKIITGLATEKLIKVQAEADESIINANTERDESMLEIERLEDLLGQKTIELSESGRTQDSMREELSQASNEIKELQIKTADKERLEKDLMEVKEDYKNAIDEKFKIAERSQKFELDLDKTQQLLDSCKNELAIAEKIVTESNKSLNSTKKQVKEKEVFIETKSKECTSLDLQNQKLQIALDQVTLKIDELKDDAKEFKTSIKEKDTELLKVEHKSGSLSGELKAISTENKGLKGKITELELMLSKQDSK